MDFSALNNYKLLPALISILQTKNLTESAKALHVTQSSMSKTLAQIREAFGDAIVIRQANQFMLTARGETLKAQLPDLIQQLDNLYRPDLLDLSQCERKFTFASSDYVAQAVFPLVCHKLAQQAPNASVEYHMWHKEGLENLADQPLDLVSTIGDTIPENLHGKEMAQDTQVVMFRSSHPLAANNGFSLDDYIAQKHVVITGGGDKDSPVEKTLAKQGKQRQIFARMPFFQSAIELLLTTDTLLTTPLHIAVDFAQRYPLQIRPLPIELKEHHYYLLWHKKYHQDPEHKWFRELCLPVLEQHLIKTIEHGMKILHSYQ
jgi:DNA-binding transcriptional LysR family regulator